MATVKPLSQAQQYQAQQQQQATFRFCFLLGLLAWLVLPLILPYLPNPLFGIDWVAMGFPIVAFLFEPMGADVVPFVPHATPYLMIQYGVLGFGIVLSLSLIQYLIALYMQRIVPLRARHAYYQLLVPAVASIEQEAGEMFLNTLHGVLPKDNPKQGSPTPFILRWTGIPNELHKQGFTILDNGELAPSIRRIAEGLTEGGVRVEGKPDPFFSMLPDARYLCVCDVKTIAPSTIPIALDGKNSAVIDALLPTLNPQTGVHCADVQILLVPEQQTSYRLAARALLESLKGDISANERRALEVKASSMAYRCSIRVAVFVDEPDVGQRMLRALAASFAGSAHTIGMVDQRLEAGPIQVFPAHMPPPKAQPTLLLITMLFFGAITASIVAWLVRDMPFLWACIPCIFALPSLVCSSIWRALTGVHHYESYRAIVAFRMPQINPRCVPIWGEWLGRND
jgi:hypothetical protein